MAGELCFPQFVGHLFWRGVFRSECRELVAVERDGDETGLGVNRVGNAKIGGGLWYQQGGVIKAVAPITGKKKK